MSATTARGARGGRRRRRDGGQGGAARLLAAGWSKDNRRWTWATTAVLASTLTILLATSGTMEGTTARTLEQVSDFYTGDLRITPSRTGALPGDWFRLDGAAGEGGGPGGVGGIGGVGAAEAFRQEGLVVSERVEAQYVLSRRGFADAYVNEQTGVPVGVPGSDADPRKVVNVGALVGILEGDPGEAAIKAQLTQGRLPRPQPGPAAVEVLMSESRARAFLTREEAQVPASLLALVGSFHFDITSAQLDPESEERTILYRPAKVVGLYATGVEMLDSFTLVAAAPEVRDLLGQDRDAPVVNVLLLQSGSVETAQAVALRNGWATQDTEGFARLFVGQLIGVLQAMALLVSGLLFLLPAALMGHGLARQLAAQERELAVATAIGVPRRTLADALTLQVSRMALWALLGAATVAVLLHLLLPLVAHKVPAPLPLGFALSWRSAAVALAVTAVSVLVSLWVGLRSRSRLPLAASLRAA